MAIQSQPSRISEPFAGSGTKNAIPATNATPSASQAASWASGFPPECSQPISAGGCPVPRNDVNGVLNQLSQDYSFRQDGGIWVWSALADYDAQRMVRGSDGLLYWSVQQSGPSVVAGAQDPTADDGTYWSIVPTDDADVVHKSGAETIAGDKTFTGGVYRQNDSVTMGVTPGTIQTWYTSFRGTNNYSFAQFGVQVGTDDAVYTTIRAHPNDTNGTHFAVMLGTDADGKSFAPNTAGTTLGRNYPSYRWGQIYSASTTISTSDARAKTAPEAVPDAVLDAWESVSFVQFQMLDSVDAKGAETARLHNGLIAQQIRDVFESRGLDPCRYGLFCWDEWQAQDEVRDQKGELVQERREAGGIYSLRYEEALCMEAACQRRRADRAEARLAALEERLAAIEAKLG